MDFSPYKPSPDENRKDQKQQKKQKAPTPYEPNPYQVGGASMASSSTLEQGLLDQDRQPTLRVNKYETTLPIRVDIEAALTYLFPPLSGLLFLVLETQNDYVRFHAWQVKKRKTNKNTMCVCVVGKEDYMFDRLNRFFFSVVDKSFFFFCLVFDHVLIIDEPSIHHDLHFQLFILGIDFR
ncbi:uncharacterized protein BX664DRAFT_259709 [Halteromyces radiatus]|uniref:uncharacterized protein n=1 Tax=Halteromyces radiatus TaxID=101107 RepID=UPI00221F02A8|nr:uncharacterized protein BX664DRAFT_259709 [Halteromyces radiatus]KAI8093897.1 hypothetical protein BX664DRAFT_259709 [Halteromyces radiatus]